MNIVRISLVLVFLGSSLLWSCLKHEDYPAVPSITFKRMDIASDNTANLYIDFIDGDGNFGLEQDDWDMSADSCRLRNNLFIKQLQLQNGVWVDVSSECLGLNYRVPWAKPSGQIQTQKGEIKIELGDNWYSTLEDDFDTLRFEIHIMDRDFNESNVLSTINYLKPE